MSEPENKNLGKGFKGLQSLGSKTPEPAAEPPAIPVRKADVPDLPEAWGEAAHQPVQPQQSKSQTTTSPWRGWIVGLGVVGAIVGFFIWAGNQSSSSNSYSAPTATDYQPSSIIEAAPPTPPSRPAITMPPVGSGLVLTSDQIRYCVYEDRRIKGAEKVVDSYSQASISTFNAMVENYNSRCGYFRYRSGALAPIENEAAQIQEQLEQEGRERMTPVQSAYGTAAAAAAAAAQSAADAAAAAADAAAAVTAVDTVELVDAGVSGPAQAASASGLDDNQQEIQGQPGDEAAATSQDAISLSKQADGLPEFAVRTPYGNGWTCMKGYSRSGNGCVPVDVPLNGLLDYTGHGWTCKRGFYQAGRQCLPVELPENATIDYTGHNWTCNRGFYKAGRQCIPVQIPDNGALDYTGHDWTCNRGFYQVGEECLAVDIPLNGVLDYTGHDWTCSRGFYQVGRQCVAVAVPANGSLDYTGHDWVCNRGFVRSGNECQSR